MIILNTPFVKIIKTSLHLEVTITCRDGSIIEHEPFPDNAEGLVNALSIATEICAGKFYLKRVVQTPDLSPSKAIGFKK